MRRQPKYRKTPERVHEIREAEQAKANVLSPPPATLAKLGSIIAHVEEGAGIDGHHFDWHTVFTLIQDADVQAWLAAMRALAFVPQPRNPKP